MKFLDEIDIKVVAGNGGDGFLSFYKSKKKISGPANGGNGGNGGNIWAIADININNLNKFKFLNIYNANNGKNGGKYSCYGKNGKDIIINMPIGTLITEFYSNSYIGELIYNKQKILLVKGGKGGLGNKSFKSSINKSPKYITTGKIGEYKKIHLELFILADIGLLGLPNVGKTTFISIISNAKPKIGNYPFTTLYPNLGIINFLDYKNKKKIIIADIPGIIPGAYKGRGLGIFFLKHLQKTKLILHIIDVSIFKIKKIYFKNKLIIKEIKKFNNYIYTKPCWLVFNKLDLIKLKNKNNIINKFITLFKWKNPIFKISYINYKNYKKIILEIYKYFNI